MTAALAPMASPGTATQAPSPLLQKVMQLRGSCKFLTCIFLPTLKPLQDPSRSWNVNAAPVVSWFAVTAYLFCLSRKSSAEQDEFPPWTYPA